MTPASWLACADMAVAVNMMLTAVIGAGPWALRPAHRKGGTAGQPARARTNADVGGDHADERHQHDECRGKADEVMPQGRREPADENHDCPRNRRHLRLVTGDEAKCQRHAGRGRQRALVDEGESRVGFVTGAEHGLRPALGPGVEPAEMARGSHRLTGRRPASDDS